MEEARLNKEMQQQEEKDDDIFASAKEEKEFMERQKQSYIQEMDKDGGMRERLEDERHKEYHRVS